MFVKWKVFYLVGLLKELFSSFRDLKLKEILNIFSDCTTAIDTVVNTELRLILHRSLGSANGMKITLVVTLIT